MSNIIVMNLKGLQFKTRKYWLWINLVTTIVCVMIVVLLDKMGFDSYWAILVYAPVTLLGFNPGMALGKEDIKKVLYLIFCLICLGYAWSAYAQRHMVGDIFQLRVLENIALVTVFLAVPGFFFGYLPVKLLAWKDKHVFNTAVYRSGQASDFIYRRLPEDIAANMTTGDLQELLDLLFGLTHPELVKNGVPDTKALSAAEAQQEILKKYSQITRIDLEKILTLEKEYMRAIGINVVNK